MSKLVTSGTGHDRCPSPSRAHQAPGHHRMVATKKLGKPAIGFKGTEKFFGDWSLRQTIRARDTTTGFMKFLAGEVAGVATAHDVRLAGKLLSRRRPGSMLLADRGYDADWIRELAMKKGAWAAEKQTAAIHSA